ncbi:MAG: superinfection immunity protein [Alphaproteobacteria bacterium]|nr:superinfection immunity protein [Alphaproteobacteria bacterium]MBN2675027.1 superinfection immunity protein [Alphaproteobacteria bacterium]
MFSISNILLFIKYIICGAIVVGVVLAPAYIARLNGKDKYNMLLVRASSWLLGWTGIGWLWSLFWSTKK